ncbi:SCO2400 family protein, partial [Streptomyces sp. G35A]
MDYCHACQRHLNGALACPGCGTPAGALRAYAEEPAAPAGHVAQAPAAATTTADAYDGRTGGYGDRNEPPDGRTGGSRTTAGPAGTATGTSRNRNEP